MIELLYATTPNCWKVTIFLEEAGVPYRLTPIRLGKGQQYTPEFLAVNPNNRVPAMIDHCPMDGGEPLVLFESGAMLLYLGEKTGLFRGSDTRQRQLVTQWLMWQMAGLGPMLGQHGHFLLYADEPNPYALDRYRGEAKRLYNVLDGQLERTGAFVAGDEYTLADMACFPWVMTHKAQNFTLDSWPALREWFAMLRARPALQKGLAAGKELFAGSKPPTGAMRRRIFGIGAGRD